METLVRIGLSNAACAAILALLAAAVSRIVPRRPGIAHALWVLVLLKLLTPPIWTIALPALRAAAPAQSVDHSTAPEPIAISHSIPSNAPIALPPHRTFSFSPWLAIAAIWLAGSAICMVVIVARVIRFQRIFKYATPAPPETALQAREAAERIGLRASPPVCFLPGPISPMLFCILGQARVLLPAALWQRLSDSQQIRLLAHELAHLRRGDHWVRLLELLATVAYWWNPFLWWSRRELHTAEEACCDAWVAWAFPCDSDEYASALIEAIDFASRPPLPALASGIGHFRSLKRRLIMIQQGHSTRSMGSLGATLIAAIALVLPFSLKVTQAQQASPPAPPTRGIIPQPARPPASQPTDEERTRQVRAQLNRTIPALQFDSVGFADAVDFLRDVSGANIHVNWPALGVAGVDRNAPVTARLRNVSFDSALKVILDSAGGGKAKLGYTVEGGIITITAVDVTNVLLATYDVQAILAGRPDYGPKLIARITETVDPSSWQEHGGNKGMIKLEDGKLFVAQTTQNQRAVSALLSRIRAENK